MTKKTNLKTSKYVHRPPKEYTWASELRWYYENFHWFHFTFLVAAVLPLVRIAQHVPLRLETGLMSAGFLTVGGVSMTAGYHRLWAHKSYEACFALRLLWAIFGASQGQWSIMWWVRHHRAHHSYTDTDRDPYNARRGFLFSHIGWLIGLNPSAWGKVDMSDLQNDPIVRWQQRYYLIIGLLVSPGLTTAIAHFGWDDWKGGLLYGYYFRMFVGYQSTFLVNSLAHAPWGGTQPYSDRHTARNVPGFLAFLSAGEGNHNFHHTFPSDYRNGLRWFEGDPTALVIAVCQWLGLAWGLKTTKASEIEEARRCQIERRAAKLSQG